MKPQRIILEGVTGSTAYGLATATSDVDIKGIYLLPTIEVLSIKFNPQKTTVDHTHPDWVYHELAKFMKLAIEGNPTITELLFLEEYTVMTEIGQQLVDNRDGFLSTRAITNAYIGYAKNQAYRLNNRTQQGLDGYDSALKNRFAKHTRHCFRLLLQARQLLETGTLTVKVTPQQRELLFNMGNRADAETIVDTFIEEADKLKEVKSVLPDEPNYKMIDELLYSIRMMK
jgi:predicted nucleotidyltransferase